MQHLWFEDKPDGAYDSGVVGPVVGWAAFAASSDSANPRGLASRTIVQPQTFKTLTTGRHGRVLRVLKVVSVSEQVCLSALRGEAER